MRRFLDEAELSSSQRMPYSSTTSQMTRAVTNERSTEDKGEVSAEDDCHQMEAMKGVIRAFRTLLHGYEEQRCVDAQQESESCESEADETICHESPRAMMAQWTEEDMDYPVRGPQRYLCDDWIQPVKVAWKPRTMTAKETKKANVAKNCLIVTLMSLELGFGSVIERYQNARDAVVERYQQGGSENPTFLPSELLTNEEMSARTTEQLNETMTFSLAPASMPPPTCLLKGKEAEALSQVHAVALKDPSLKMYHVMSVKQTLREDLAECAYQFSCRAADWTRSDMHAVANFTGRGCGGVNSFDSTPIHSQQYSCIKSVNQDKFCNYARRTEKNCRFLFHEAQKRDSQNRETPESLRGKKQQKHVCLVAFQTQTQNHSVLATLLLKSQQLRNFPNRKPAPGVSSKTQFQIANRS